MLSRITNIHCRDKSAAPFVGSWKKVLAGFNEQGFLQPLSRVGETWGESSAVVTPSKLSSIQLK